MSKTLRQTVTTCILVSMVTCVSAQYINLHRIDNVTESYALADVSKLTYTGNSLNMFFVDGASMSWNLSVVKFLDYEDSGLGVSDLSHDSLRSFSLYPNPSTAEVNIELYMYYTGRMSIEVWNLHGRKLTTLYEGIWDIPRKELVWNGLDESGNPAMAGVYFCTLRTETRSFSRTIIRTEQ